MKTSSFTKVLALMGPLCLSSLARGQTSSSLLPPLDTTPVALGADSDQGLERQTVGNTEFQRTCPQPVGDAYDLTAQSAWNVLEIGIQVSPDQKPSPTLEAYTRYTCAAPLERTKRR